MTLSWTRTHDWDDGGWRRDAACRDAPAELFFPVGTTGPAIRTIDAAKAVCGACRVREACLAFALATAQDAGVWGGTTEEERRALRARARASRVS